MVLLDDEEVVGQNANRTKCQPDKMPTGQNANRTKSQPKVGILSGLFIVVGIFSVPILGWHFVRTISTNR